jgi:hypothetical protein
VALSSMLGVAIIACVIQHRRMSRGAAGTSASPLGGRDHGRTLTAAQVAAAVGSPPRSTYIDPADVAAAEEAARARFARIKKGNSARGYSPSGAPTIASPAAPARTPSFSGASLGGANMSRSQRIAALGDGNSPLAANSGRGGAPGMGGLSRAGSGRMVAAPRQASDWGGAYV